MSSISVFSQQRRLSGSVTHQDTPLPGVNVLVKGTLIGTLTDFDGNFTIDLPEGASVLKISSMGYITQEVNIGKILNIKIQLLPSLVDLDEVVVIGYGTSKKSDLTGSVASVDTKDINKQSNANIALYLQGKVTGVHVIENSGAPGAGAEVQIRGTNSINASSKPLYVIDGMPFESDGASELQDVYSGGFVSSPLANINPNDIQSIEILKDASATAIYGSRGANGVVLITTKSGEIGKAKVNISLAQSVSRVAKRIELLNGEQYAELANEASAYRYGLENIPFTETELSELPNIDHQNEVYGLGNVTDVSVSVSGGTDKNKYFVSGQFFDQEGVFPGTGYQKGSININFEQKITEKILLNTNAKIFNSVANGSLIGGYSGGLIRNTLSWVPTAPMVREDGSYVFVNGYFLDSEGYVKERYLESAEADGVFLTNPMSILEDYESKNTTNQVLYNIGVTYEFNDKLKLKLKYGYSNYKSFLQSYRATTVILVGSNEQGYANIGHSSSVRSLYESTLHFKDKAGKNHFNGVLGISGEDIEKTISKASAWGFLQDITGYDDIGAATAPQPTVSSYTGNSLASILARINYHYNYKYYATISARYDGSSKFKTGNKWGFFPSLGLSWRIHKENFLENNEAVNEFKLRASIGVTGNQSIQPYQTLGQFYSQENPGRTNFNFGNNVNIGYAPVRLQNEDLTWEETLQTDIGIDLGLFKNRISFIVDVYQKDTKDLLFNIDAPSTSGFSSILANVGEIRNRGLELTLMTKIVQTKNFKWTTSGNISWNRNEVMKLSGKTGEQFIAGEVFGKPISILEVGSPIGEFYGYKMQGIWSEEDIANKPSTFMPDAFAGDRRFVDINNDGVLNFDDRVVIGSSQPDFFGGFDMEVVYKRIRLYTSFSFSYGNDIFNELKRYTLGLHGGANTSIDALDRWRPITAEMTPEEVENQLAHNSITNIPRAGNYSQVEEVSDAYIEDASYLRCNNLSLSYMLPSIISEKLSLSSINLTGSIENLFTISKYSGYSPVGNSRGGLVKGVDSGLYPTMQTFKFAMLINL